MYLKQKMTGKLSNFRAMCARKIGQVKSPATKFVAGLCAGLAMLKAVAAAANDTVNATATSLFANGIMGYSMYEWIIMLVAGVILLFVILKLYYHSRNG